MNAQTAPNSSDSLIIATSNDAQEHAHNLRDWQQHYDQMSAGDFKGEIIERPFSQLQVFKEHTSQALSQSCLVWPDSVWLGIPPICQSKREKSKINGLALNSHDIMCRPGNTEFELATPDNFDIFGIVITHEKLNEHAQKQDIHIQWQDILQNERLNIPTDTHNAINYLLDRLLCKQYQNNTPDHLTQDLILMGLMEVVSKESPNQTIETSYQHRKTIVNTARDFLSTHQDRAITLAELCEACHTSRRTLQNSFESILGISPIQYLRYSRLNGVRRDLKASKQGEQVGDIAACWGFWHLSQFAKDYKNVFGELPKETLQASIA
ncbi:MAG: helix-turn-helix domain-containing protein [Gammaproteobacteria bacterium]|nr:helix-turn-helix domain-containing protein [Gammaproteobacteria bacterium]